MGRYMESPDGILAVHSDHEPVWVVPSVWCPAFRRSGPAKAGTPNRRFMESGEGKSWVRMFTQPPDRLQQRPAQEAIRHREINHDAGHIDECRHKRRRRCGGGGVQTAAK